MDREIGDTEHPSIRDAAQLHIWFHKEQTFKLISSRNFPRSNRPGTCKVCTPGINKSTGKPYSCQVKYITWESFKHHLKNAEKSLGELIAFPSTIATLPQNSNYLKYRKYGNLHHYMQRNDFYIFDIKQNDFVYVMRSNLSKEYSNRKQICTYCPCSYKIKSPTTLIKHLQVIETRFHCFLILDSPDQNDDRNMVRIQKFIASLNSKVQNADEESSDENADEIILDEINRFKTYEYDEINENIEDIEDDDKITLLNKFEAAYLDGREGMNNYFERLKDKLFSTNLDRGIIDAQDQMTLCRKMEDYQEGKKEFKFMKEINLKYDNLDYLMNKYGISNEYEICESNVTLIIQLEEEVNPSNQEQQHTYSSPYKNINLYKRNGRISSIQDSKTKNCNEKLKDDNNLNQFEKSKDDNNLNQIEYNKPNYLEIDDETNEISDSNDVQMIQTNEVAVENNVQLERTNSNIMNDHSYNSVQMLDDDSQETMDGIEKILDDLNEKSNKDEVDENGNFERQSQVHENQNDKSSEKVTKTPDNQLIESSRANTNSTSNRSSESSAFGIFKNIFMPKIKKERDDVDSFDLMNCKRSKKS